VGTLEQIDEADLAFQGRVAERVGARVRVRSGQLEVMATGSLVAKPTLITAKDIEAWHAPLGERLRAGTVVARWHSALKGEAGEGCEPTWGRGAARRERATQQGRRGVDGDRGATLRS
jgi:phage protein D